MKLKSADDKRRNQVQGKIPGLRGTFLLLGCFETIRRAIEDLQAVRNFTPIMRLQQMETSPYDHSFKSLGK
jgi:hypothetical protein